VLSQQIESLTFRQLLSSSSRQKIDIEKCICESVYQNSRATDQSNTTCIFLGTVTTEIGFCYSITKRMST